jgi:shikimate kinase
MRVTHVVLVGLMGSGKSTVGRALADELSWPMSDSDEAIERRCGATVRELNERLGTAAMHRLEAEHLLGAIAEHEHSVVCAAASVVDVASCRDALRAPGVFAVWLENSAATLAARFGQGPHRPLLDADPAHLFEQQLAERAAHFAELHAYEIHPGDRTPKEIAEEIVRAIGGQK